MISFRTCVCILASCVLAFLLAGCGGSDPAPGFGDWTLEEGALTLERDLFVGDEQDFYFGSIADMDVTSDGRMVVADEAANHVKVLAPDGILSDTIGRSGTGPGEFRKLRNVQVARSDSLYTYDMQLSRITVFVPDTSYNEFRTITVSRQRGIPIRIRVVEEGFVARVIIPTRPQPGVSRTAPRIWRRIGESGALGDTLLTTPGYRVLATDTGFRPIPMSSGVDFAWGPNGQLYHGWTDSLHFKARSLDGSSEVIASIPTEPVPLTEADRDSLLEGIDGEMRSKMTAALPDTKPAFTDLVVADDGQLWVQRPAEGPNLERVPWWVLDPETKTIYETRVPRDVEVHVVRDGRLYGTTTTEDGAPVLVRYTIQRTN